MTLEETDRQGYIDFMDGMPLLADPECFGLHENGAITSARNNAFDMLSTILSMEAGGGGSGGQSRDEVLSATAKEILQKTPEPYDLRDVMAKYPVMYEDSMNTVLTQEAVRYNKLLTVMAKTLKAFAKALRGEVVMSGDLEEMGTMMFNNQVPTKWAGAAYPSLHPLSKWVEDLLRRVAFIQDWYDNGHPAVFWISGLYFPQGFLTGSKQNFARTEQTAIDRISFATIPMLEPRDQLKHPPQGVYVDGIYMEGAQWSMERQVITESRPKELFTTMPCFWFNPTIDRKVILNKLGIPGQPGSGSEGRYTCPLYKTLLRAGLLSTTGHSTNFVLPLEIPTATDEKHWIKRGVACFLALRV